jgi:hypothetical protein
MGRPNLEPTCEPGLCLVEAQSQGFALGYPHHWWGALPIYHSPRRQAAVASVTSSSSHRARRSDEQANMPGKGTRRIRIRALFKPWLTAAGAGYWLLYYSTLFFF